MQITDKTMMILKYLSAILMVGISTQGFCGVRTVTLEWNPNPENDIAGYWLYYGTANTNFTPSIDVTNGTTATVQSLPDNTRYYFAVKAYNWAGLESDWSQPIWLDAVSGSPAIASLSVQTINEETSLALQLTALNFSSQNTLTWQLGPGAPAGLNINASTGVLTWLPTEAQGPSSNVITVIVRDNGKPSLSATQTFTIVVNEVNRPPALAATPDQIALPFATLVVTNTASDPDLPLNHLRFSLDLGAPISARINPTNGLFSWRPARIQFPSTNTVTVRVNDDGWPALSTTRTFTVVAANYLEMWLGSTAVLAGQTGSVSIGIDVTTPITNASFLLDVPVAGLADFSLAPPSPPLASATLQSTGFGQFQVDIQTLSGQYLVGTQTVSSVRFRAVPNGPSAFIPLRVAKLSAKQLNGRPLTQTYAHDGRAVFIGGAPLLEVSNVGAKPQLVIYARPGPSYTVYGNSSLAAPVLWTPLWNGSISNLIQVVTNLPTANPSSVYRVTAP